MNNTKDQWQPVARETCGRHGGNFSINKIFEMYQKLKTDFIADFQLFEELIEEILICSG